MTFQSTFGVFHIWIGSCVCCHGSEQKFLSDFRNCRFTSQLCCGVLLKSRVCSLIFLCVFSVPICKEDLINLTYLTGVLWGPVDHLPSMWMKGAKCNQAFVVVVVNFISPVSGRVLCSAGTRNEMVTEGNLSYVWVWQVVKSSSQGTKLL